MSENFFKYLNDRLRFKSGSENVTNLFYVILIIFVFITIGSIFYLKNQLKTIENNWEKYKCHPAVIPFAGWIKKDPNRTPTDVTAYNLQVCISEVLKNIVKIFLAPFNAIFGGLNTFFAGLVEGIQVARTFLWKLKNIILGMLEKIINFLASSTNLLAFIFSKINDTIKRSVGILVSLVYGFISIIYWMFGSFKRALKIIVIILIILILLMIIAAYFLWNPAGVIAFRIIMAAFTFIITPFAIFTVLLAIYIDLIDGMLPKDGDLDGCFDKNTIIETKKGPKRIKNLKIGDKLSDGAIITGVFKISSTFNKKMYNLNNVLVTGTHKVICNNDMIYVKDHPCAIELEDYREPILYCLNTSSKRIFINGVEFMDWDEIQKTDLDSLRMCGYLNSSQSYEDIHKQLDGGFDKSVKLEMYEGGSVNINKIKVNDVLKFGERVVCVIKIDAESLMDIKKYNINGCEFISGPNVMIEDDDLGKVSTLFLEGESLIKRPRYLYSIITDTGKFYLDGMYFYDYNGGIEEILDNMAFARQLS